MSNRKIEVREGATFDLHFDDKNPEVYVEGIAQMMMGAPNTKLLFYTSKGADNDGVEQRYVNETLVMPTHAVMQMLMLFKEQFTKVHEEIALSDSAASERLKKLLSELTSEK